MGLFNDAMQQIGSMAASGIEKRQQRHQIEDEEQKIVDFEQQFAQQHQAFIAKEQDDYESDRASRAVRLKLKEADMGHGFYNFSVLDDLKPEFHEHLIKMIRILFYGRYKAEVKGLLDETSVATVDIVSINLKNFAYFDEFRDKVEHTIRHFDFFMTHECLESVYTMMFNEEISKDGILRIPSPDEIARSLTDTGDTESASNILHWETAINAIADIDLINWYPLRSKFQMLTETVSSVTETQLEPSVEELLSGSDLVDEKYIQAADMALGADHDESHYSMIKIGLLRAALHASDHEAHANTYEFLKAASELLMGVFVSWEEKGESTGAVAVPVDVVVAEAIRLNKSGMIEEITPYLETQLNIYAHAKFDVQWQFTFLANFFSAIKAYEQELIVLESMVSHNLARTEQQEARLAFLKGGGVATATAMADKLDVSYTKEDGKLAIDYRVLSWSENQISALFDMASGNNKLQDTPLVVAEWSRSIQTPNIRWDNESVAERVQRCVAENFGDALIATNGEVGIIMDGDLDYTNTVIVKPTETSKYSWLGFVLSGEQLTQKQASLSLFAIYWPDKDFTGESSIIQRNTKAINRTLMLKLGQNPKIKNYISTVETLLVDTLEEYFNSSNTDDIY